ncbi:hypothetical protein IID27_01065 [Patescibacteria group bacterium]|nr:hypothetical protein [Patescibacteria group bacterium]
MSKAIIVSYVPSPHRGYIEFFRKYEGGVLYVMGSELIKEHTSLVRNLPANTPEDVVRMLRSLGIFSEVHVLKSEGIRALMSESSLVMPDEDVSHALAEKYFKGTLIHYESVWLRWDWGSSRKKNAPIEHRAVTYKELDRELMGRAYEQSEKSSDWWRQVGAIAVKDGAILFGAFNRHQPSEHTPYLVGDPRSHFEPGESIEMSSALHAEVGIISAAARNGVCLEGASLYITTFPCPPCAYAIANSGIKHVYYAEGYSLLGAQEVLIPKGVELVHVRMDPPLSA